MIAGDREVGGGEAVMAVASGGGGSGGAERAATDGGKSVAADTAELIGSTFVPGHACILYGAMQAVLAGRG